ncbi:MAG TPA: HAD family hydrolase, partial [Gammaproteobacteria bacterium]|nr:HAD family hydrolase [Gammaproteobacteria bacterium]
GFFSGGPIGPAQVQAAAAYLTDHAGGQGAVRELCVFLLVAQGFDPLALYQEDRV